MCGICLVIENIDAETRKDLFLTLCPTFDPKTLSNSFDCGEDLEERCLIQIQRRGPTLRDGRRQIIIRNRSRRIEEETLDEVTRDNEASTDLRCCLYAAVLHLRGVCPTPQPLNLPKDSRTSKITLAWNGEVFGGAMYLECEKNSTMSDTDIICMSFCNLYDKYSTYYNLDDFEKEGLALLEAIDGPFAVVIHFSSPIDQIWIARDKIGRRSLCLMDPQPHRESGSIILTSVGPSMSQNGPYMAEVGVSGVFVLDRHSDARMRIRCFPWKKPIEFNSKEFWSAQLSIEPPLLQFRDATVIALENLLLNAIKIMISIPEQKSTLSPGTQLDLLNVAFGQHLEAPDRFTALATYQEIQSIDTFGTAFQQINLVCIDISKSESIESRTAPTNLIFLLLLDELKANELAICSLLHPKNSHMDLNIGAALFFASRGIGFLIRPEFHQNENQNWWSHYLEGNDNHCDPAASAVSVVIENLPASIEKRHEAKTKVVVPRQCSNCHLMRKPGCAYELCRLCCERGARQKPEVQQCKIHHIRIVTEIKPASESMKPHSCLYQTGIGQMLQSCPCCGEAAILYSSRAPVVLVGHGADELFGGYGRHATADMHNGLAGARDEMTKDLRRLWERNLGRDDRCVSDWGREARHPFLDEEVGNQIYWPS
ncbi:uncharacterized protein LOC129618212 [Condylostylus longicornis]|uniref:uncharacterized protein LOC129618212 n=1 Tax=Condylostylus longicornis TaxID=2530218 RepID=UPI00244E1502|nr:uncharacterized protein LOC129618212 [Condylostylus longicornis]